MIILRKSMELFKKIVLFYHFTMRHYDNSHYALMQNVCTAYQ